MSAAVVAASIFVGPIQNDFDRFKAVAVFILAVVLPDGGSNRDDKDESYPVVITGSI
jgi:hypothetical protein